MRPGVVVLALLALVSAPAAAQDVAPQTDMAITATVSPAAVDSDQPIVLTFVVTNSGPSTASADVQFRIPVPSAVDKTAGDWYPPAPGPEGSLAGWYVAQMPAGASATLRLTFKLRRATDYEADLMVEGAADQNASNDKATGRLDVHQTKAFTALTSHVSPHLLRRPYPPVNIGGELIVDRAQRKPGWCSGHVGMRFDNFPRRPLKAFGHARARLHLVAGHCRYRLFRRFGARHPHIRVLITFAGNAVDFNAKPVMNFANLL